MIDAVVTWVDGADPAHRAKRARHGDGAAAAAVEETRFASSGEVYFAVRSLLRFCSFVRRIHVVTDAQHPAPLDPLLSGPEGGRIRIVDHHEIYGEHADLLPVFSSRSIETMIHRIPGLADRFLYLNDDIFVGREMRAEDYFDGERPVLRGRMARLPGPLLAWAKARLRPERPGYAAAQRAAARSLGRRRDYLMLEHTPHALRRDTLADFYARRPEALRAQAGFRFRDAGQLSPVGLAMHLELTAGARVAAPQDTGYVRPGRPAGAALARVMERLEAGGFASFCVQSLDRMARADRDTVLAGLRAYYG